MSNAAATVRSDPWEDVMLTRSWMLKTPKTLWCFVAILIAATADVTGQVSAAGDGVVVHGHWTIEVHDSSGALLGHHEFNNALTPEGIALLNWQLLGEALGGPLWTYWRVYVEGRIPFRPSPCRQSNSSFNRHCVLIDVSYWTDQGLPIPSQSQGISFATLNVSAAGPELLLRGQFVATNGAPIGKVSTQLFRATGGDPPVVSMPGYFTVAYPPEDIPLEQGQLVTIVVRISFS